MSESLEGCQLRNYCGNNKLNYGGIIHDYVDRSMKEKGEKMSTFKNNMC